MGKVVSAAYFPVPFYIFEDPSENTQQIFNGVKKAIIEAAANIKKSNPQTIIILSRYRWTLDDAIGISPQARLQAILGENTENPITFGAESDSTFILELKRQCYRMGIPLSDILNNLPTISTEDYQLHRSAAIALYYLQQAGLGNKQIVRLTMGHLSYEELYTFGKLLQITAEKCNRRIAIIGASNLLSPRMSARNTGHKVSDINYAVMTALADCSPKVLTDLGYPQEEFYALRTAAFVMGATSGLKTTLETHYYEVIKDHAYGVIQFKVN